ncbi:HlyD family secretion protein [Leptolyngbya sp. FACHB-261]|uniref:HlyD family secretion protein n=1 Tax=Leptolyngbya sp. FACHB-261 TaxID=2692806 RepID=UPI00168695CB|nr:HlyD family efflux transporter periplasmic adaptor subunit [Leptolyngbya sp. FACHB-261]MBD2100767.1 HlyD family efflux transporter periplasmic adaptor subunit [Leptolyngbya sp. FACHB-261]
MLETPDAKKLVARSPNGTLVALPPDPQHKRKKRRWERLVFGALFLSIGAAATAVGIAAIGYRLTHIVVDNGLVNGRIMRMRAPIDGAVSAFYAQPGVAVNPGQVLARLSRSPEEQQSRLRLEGEVELKEANLASSRKSLAVLKSQLEDLNDRIKILSGQRPTSGPIDTSVVQRQLAKSQAQLDSARARASVARSKYNRYAQLVQEGAVSKSLAEQFRGEWESRQAEVREAESGLQVSQAALEAARLGKPVTSLPNVDSGLLSQRSSLLSGIQSQEGYISTLEVELRNARARLKEDRSLYSNRQDLEVKAPFAGVVYSTKREEGEQVRSSESLLTLLDCNNIWVESLVNLDQFNQIDASRPVRVQLAGNPEKYDGKIELMQPVNSVQETEGQSNLLQVQALVPSVPSELAGQSLMRVIVRIPPPPQHAKAQQFCGLGSNASVTFPIKFAQMPKFVAGR